MLVSLQQHFPVPKQPINRGKKTDLRMVTVSMNLHLILRSQNFLDNKDKETDDSEDLNIYLFADIFTSRAEKLDEYRDSATFNDDICVF